MRILNLFILILLLLTVVSARSKKATVATDLPAIESILQDLTKNTPISVIKVIPDNISIKEERNFLKENISYSDSVASIIDAAFDIRSIWPQEAFYRDLRIKNVRIIEVDLASPFDPRITGVAVVKNGSTPNTYPWLCISNILKMYEIAYKNMVLLYPRYEKVFTDNLLESKKKFFDLKSSYEEKFSALNDFSLISMSRDFDYLLSGLNIFVENYFPADYSDWSDEQKKSFRNSVMKRRNCVILRWKPLEDEFSNICDSANVIFIQPKIGELRVDGIKKGLFEFTSNNIETIYQSLKKRETGE